MRTEQNIGQIGPGDVELLIRVSAGDSAAGEPLLARHRDAVADLGPSEGFDSVDSSGKVALAMVRNGIGKNLPFRAAWLSMHAQGTLPTSAARGNAAWDAFCALPAAWQIAVWHHEVEGESIEEIASHLGTTVDGAERALAGATSSLRRRVALSSAGKPISPQCEEIQGTYRFAAPTTLSQTDSRTLRQHGRTCPSCQPMTSQLLILEHTLRDSLAGVVLGASASRYLELRRRPARLHVAGRSPARGDGSASSTGFGQRRALPVIAGLTAGAVGIAAAVSALLGPTFLPATDVPDDAVAVAEPSVAGALLRPLDETRAGPTTPEPSPETAPAGRTPSTSPGTVAPSVGGATSGDPTVDQPGGNGDPDPEPPVGPDDPDDPDDPDEPTDNDPVTVESSPDGTTVTVNPGVTDPIVIELPVGANGLAQKAQGIRTLGTLSSATATPAQTQGNPGKAKSPGKGKSKKR